MPKPNAENEVEVVEAEVLDAQSATETADEQATAPKQDFVADSSVQSDEQDDSFDFIFSKDKATEAVGISYNEDELAPVIAAIGKGERAQAIVDMAKELGIYIHRDPLLLNQLKQLKEGEQVPEELFTIIATILSFSYILQGKTPGIYKRADGSKAVNLKA